MLDVDAVAGFTEPVSSWTHLAGAAVFLGLSVPLLRQQLGRPRALGAGQVLALGGFAAAVVFMLTASGVYHLLGLADDSRQLMQRLDHVSIFTLMAACVTAIHAILFAGAWRWMVIVGAWSICALLATYKLVYFTQTPESVSLAMFLGMGWLGLVTAIAVWRRCGFRFVYPLLLGGLSYTIGAVLEFAGQPVLLPGVIGPHELFHVFVLIGLGIHWRFIYSVLSMRQGELTGADRAPTP